MSADVSTDAGGKTTDRAVRVTGFQKYPTLGAGTATGVCRKLVDGENGVGGVKERGLIRRAKAESITYESLAKHWMNVLHRHHSFVPHCEMCDVAMSVDLTPIWHALCGEKAPNPGRTGPLFSTIRKLTVSVDRVDASDSRSAYQPSADGAPQCNFALVHKVCNMVVKGPYDVWQRVLVHRRRLEYAMSLWEPANQTKVLRAVGCEPVATVGAAAGATSAQVALLQRLNTWTEELDTETSRVEETIVQLDGSNTVRCDGRVHGRKEVEHFSCGRRASLGVWETLSGKDHLEKKGEYDTCMKCQFNRMKNDRKTADYLQRCIEKCLETDIRELNVLRKHLGRTLCGVPPDGSIVTSETLHKAFTDQDGKCAVCEQSLLFLERYPRGIRSWQMWEWELERSKCVTESELPQPPHSDAMVYRECGQNGRLGWVHQYCHRGNPWQNVIGVGRECVRLRARLNVRISSICREDGKASEADSTGLAVYRLWVAMNRFRATCNQWLARPKDSSICPEWQELLTRCENGTGDGDPRIRDRRVVLQEVRLMMDHYFPRVGGNDASALAATAASAAAPSTVPAPESAHRVVVLSAESSVSSSPAVPGVASAPPFPTVPLASSLSAPCTSSTPPLSDLSVPSRSASSMLSDGCGSTSLDTSMPQHSFASPRASAAVENGPCGGSGSGSGSVSLTASASQCGPSTTASASTVVPMSDGAAPLVGRASGGGSAVRRQETPDSHSKWALAWWWRADAPTFSDAVRRFKERAAQKKAAEQRAADEQRAAAAAGVPWTVLYMSLTRPRRAPARFRRALETVDSSREVQRAYVVPRAQAPVERRRGPSTYGPVRRRPHTSEGSSTGLAGDPLDTPLVRDETRREELDSLVPPPLEPRGGRRPTYDCGVPLRPVTFEQGSSRSEDPERRPTASSTMTSLLTASEHRAQLVPTAVTDRTNRSSRTSMEPSHAAATPGGEHELSLSPALEWVGPQPSRAVAAPPSAAQPRLASEAVRTHRPPPTATSAGNGAASTQPSTNHPPVVWDRVKPYKLPWYWFEKLNEMIRDGNQEAGTKKHFPYVPTHQTCTDFVGPMEEKWKARRLAQYNVLEQKLWRPFTRRELEVMDQQIRSNNEQCGTFVPQHLVNDGCPDFEGRLQRMYDEAEVWAAAESAAVKAAAAARAASRARTSVAGSGATWSRRGENRSGVGSRSHPAALDPWP